MSERKRLHRRDPARMAPIRRYSGIWSRSQPSNSGDRVSAGNSNEETTRPTGKSGSAAEAVELGYRIIDDYLREGQRTARQLNNRPYSPRANADNFSELVERILRNFNEMFPTWVELVGSLASADRLRTPAPQRHDPRSTNGASNHTATALSIEIASKKPIEVSLELRSESDGLALMTHGLRAVDLDKPPLIDIAFIPGRSNGRRALRIRVPDDQPPGIYSGVIVDRARGETHGTLSVAITD